LRVSHASLTSKRCSSIKEVADTITKNSPLFIAIEEGSNPSIAAILDSGADNNHTVFLKRPHARLIPLEYAILCRRNRCAHYLLSRGAIIPPVSQWPANHQQVYNTFRRGKFERDGVLTIGYDEFGTLGDEARAAL
jgi:hypothetical protein